MIPRILLLFLLCLIAFSGGTSARETAAKGDLMFFLDTASFRRGGNSSITEIYIRIPNAELRFKKVKESFQSRARLSLQIKDDQGRTVAEQSETLDFSVFSQEHTTAPVRFQTAIKRFQLASGGHRLSCALEDLNAPKTTVIGFLKKKFSTALIDGYTLEVPAFPEEALSVSDAKFLGNAQTVGGKEIHVPNPSRLYGLYLDSLRVYVEGYCSDQVAAESLRFECVILDDKGEVFRESPVPLPASGIRGQTPGDEAGAIVTWPLVVTEDLNQFPAGSYTMYLNGGLEDQLLVRVRCGSFSVAWDLRTWEVSRRNFLTEARFLLADEDYASFSRKSIGEQEAVLKEMWKELDPDPLTGINEAYEEFLTRLEYVNARYSDYQMGIFTDRGLIYLKYGPPDDMVVDVIPLNRESISDALEKVRDKYHTVNFSNTGGRMGYAQPSKDIIVDPRRLGKVGEGGETAYPYELWLYNGGGRAILERDQTMEPDIGLRFIFVDREGYGRYKLESSSSMINK